MEANNVLDLYVREVAEQLPRRQRGDVSLELQELLKEEFDCKSLDLGRPLDHAGAVEFLRSFGDPKEVAVRYGSSWTIVPEAETRNFLTAAGTGIGAIVAATLWIPEWNRPQGSVLATLVWLGALLVYFGARSFAKHRWGSRHRWVPRDRDRTSRLGGVLLISLIALGVVVYGAPAWVYGRLTGGGTLSEWLSYDPEFYRERLPWLLALWLCQASLIAFVTLRGRWDRALRRLELTLSLLAVAILLWFIAAGQMFVYPGPDSAARIVAGVAAVLIVVDVFFRLQRGLGTAAPRPEHSIAG